MPESIQYKCPNCGGYLEFNSESQKLSCPFCDSLFAADSFPGSASVQAEQSPDVDSPRQEYSNDEADEFAIFHCSSCGADIIAEQTLAATSCPYCSNNIILTGQLAGKLKPDLIIPFKYDKNAAKKALQDFFVKKPLLPKVFSEENHLDEIKGIYVPYWLYDAHADAEGTYKMTKVRTWSDMNYQYTETSHFSAYRQGNLSFEMIPVDAADSIPNKMTESLEPFDYKSIKPFSTVYLSGYYANRYDVSSDECIKRARERIDASTDQFLSDTIRGYSSVSGISERSVLTDITIRYALLPVWLLNTTWRGKQYTFAMNGQTGKLVGNLPIDRWLYWKYRLLYFVGISGGLYLLSFLFRGMF